MKIRFKIKRSLIVEIISSLFILLFVYTAVSKLFTQEQFKLVLSKSPLLENFASYIALGLPILELLLAGALFFPRYRQLGLINSTILMTLFTGYLIYMVYFTPHLPCSCGGVLAELSWKEHIIFNISFLILGAIAISLNRTKSNQSKDYSNPLPSYS